MDEGEGIAKFALKHTVPCVCRNRGKLTQFGHGRHTRQCAMCESIEYDSSELDDRLNGA